MGIHVPTNGRGFGVTLRQGMRELHWFLSSDYKTTQTFMHHSDSTNIRLCTLFKFYHSSLGLYLAPVGFKVAQGSEWFGVLKLFRASVLDCFGGLINLGVQFVLGFRTAEGLVSRCPSFSLWAANP